MIARSFATAALALAACSATPPTPGASDAGDGGSGDARDGGTRDGGGTDGGIPSGTVFCDLPGGAATGLTVPADLCIHKFAQLKTPRVLAFAPGGEVFVASPSAFTAGGAPAGIGGIYALADDDGDGVADAPAIYARSADLSTVHGLAFVSDHELVYTVGDAVYALPYASGQRTGDTTARAKLAGLPTGGASRFTHTLATGADGSLYVSTGQTDNDQCPATIRVGAVLRVGPGHDPAGDVVVSGCRNPMYLRCAPWGCYAAELTGDGWSGIGGAEKLIEVKDGADYGYPCCIDHGVPNPQLSPPPSPAPGCSQVAVSVQSYPLHDTPFGFDFDVPRRWPAPYTGGLFIAMHGSFFNHWAGERVGWAPVDATTHRPTADLATLVGGFGMTGPVVGRPADARFSPDGRLFIADDQGGGVYWIAPRTLKKP